MIPNHSILEEEHKNVIQNYSRLEGILITVTFITV